MWTIFKVFIEFATILLLSYLFFFGFQACETLTPQPGSEPSSPALQGGLNHWATREAPSSLILTPLPISQIYPFLPLAVLSLPTGTPTHPSSFYLPY